MNRRLKWRSPALLAVGLWVGALLGNTLWGVSATHAKSTPKSPSTQVTTWHGLPQVNAKFLKWILHAKVENSQGQTMTLSHVKNPLYFFAGWCPFCAKTDRLLVQSHLMSHLQLVNVSLDGGEKGTALKPMQVQNVSQAIQALARDWRYYGIHWSVSNVDFAMPGGSINQDIQQFPLVWIPHAGKWYVQVGYNPSVQFWKSILS